MLLATTAVVGDPETATERVGRLIVFVALADWVVALLALAVAVLMTGPAGVPAATCATMVKLYVPGAAEAIEQVTVPAAPTAGVVQNETPPAEVSPPPPNVAPPVNGSDSDALVA